MSNSERILKICQYFVKLWARVRCLVFLTHGVYIAYFAINAARIYVIYTYMNPRSTLHCITGRLRFVFRQSLGSS